MAQAVSAGERRLPGGRKVACRPLDVVHNNDVLVDSVEDPKLRADVSRKNSRRSRRDDLVNPVNARVELDEAEQTTDLPELVASEGMEPRANGIGDEEGEPRHAGSRSSDLVPAELAVELLQWRHFAALRCLVALLEPLH